MSNRFALLAEDGDSGDEGIKSVPTTKTEKPAVVGAPKKVAPAPNAAKANQQAQAGNRKDNYPGRTGQGRKVLSEDGPREGKENTKRAGGDARGSARGRGGRGRGRNPRPDRHSQMDRETSNKADAQAWGGDDGQRELDDETNAQKDADREAANKSGVATPANADGASTPAPVEEEDKTQSYAEYLAAQVASAGESLAEKLGLANKPRQANEGADEAQWKNAKPFTKDEDDSFFAGGAKDKKNKNKQKEGKTFIEFETPSYRPQTGGRGAPRGAGRGRGAPRGDGSRGRGGAARGGNNGARAQKAGGPDLSEAAFPSLS